MSGVRADRSYVNKLCVMNSLLHILCRRGGGIHAKIDLLVQKAVFVSDHKVSLGTIFGDQEPQPLRILGDVENEICGVGFARPQRFFERRRRATDASKRRLTWR